MKLIMKKSILRIVRWIEGRKRRIAIRWNWKILVINLVPPERVKEIQPTMI
jgi:hypothetical protein